MVAADSFGKGKQVFSASYEEGSDEEEEEDEEEISWSGQGNVDDDDDDFDGGSEWEEEDLESQEQDYSIEEIESDQAADGEYSDEDKEYEPISEDQTMEDDDETVGDCKEKKPSDEVLSGRVVNLLQRNNKLDTLKLEECKAYLRKHELMISGTKTTCIMRILEHWRLKDGNGERLYPKQTFVINCTGDVCKGDVVMFKQRVYEKFDKVSRSGKILGKRTIAGRVVKESYGEAKQQHTFTIEVLWSKGVKALLPMCSLLVKGRNLYRDRTFRQPWCNEAERSKVLDEKHKRGAIARNIRTSAKYKIGAGSKRQRSSFDSIQSSKKRLKKHLEANSTKKGNEASKAKTQAISRSNRKHATLAQPSKKHGKKPQAINYKNSTAKTYAGPLPKYGSSSNNEVKPSHLFSQKMPLQNICYPSHHNLRISNGLVAQEHWGRLHIPEFNNLMNQDMNSWRHSNYFAHPYSTYSQGTSDRFFRPFIHDNKFPSFSSSSWKMTPP
ncbi:hypothetical protein HPP92_003656 [Vanilla planifolia]|nr:hypothetical protein HPP92_003656 [Vanilla planifolia]